MRKFEAIDLMKLYSSGSHKGWNKTLTDLHARLDINGLAKLRYQIQAGMDDLAKKKLNHEEIIIWYLRLIKSIEHTAKKIIRTKNPLPGDDPLKAKNFPNHLAIKRKRDQELDNFLNKSNY